MTLPLQVPATTPVPLVPVTSQEHAKETEVHVHTDTYKHTQEQDHMVESQVITPTTSIQEKEREMEKDDKDPKKTSKKRVTSVGPGPNEIHVDVFTFIAQHVDDLFSLYSDNMKRDAIQTLQDKLVTMLTDGAVPKWLGPKKTRIIIGWLTHNNRGTPASDESGKIVSAFISWFLDITVSYTPKDTVKGDKKSGSQPHMYEMYRKRGAWWTVTTTTKNEV